MFVGRDGKTVEMLKFVGYINSWHIAYTGST